MFDGISLKCCIKDLKQWKQTTNLQLSVSVDLDTAEIKTRKRLDQIITTQTGKFEHYDLTVKEVLNTTTNKIAVYLNVNGSLHKNYYSGKNHQPFTYIQVAEEINHLCKSLCINPKQAKISNLEVGVNIVTPFKVTPFLMHSMISYKTHSFNKYKKDSKGVCLGIYCPLSHYIVKAYDKGVQNDLNINLMRIEKRFRKMQDLNKKGIRFLSDLLDSEKVYQLLHMLLDMWDNALIYDIEEKFNQSNLEILSQSDKNLLIKGQNSNFWETLKGKNKRQYNYERSKFKRLVLNNGYNSHQIVKELIKNEWQNHFEIGQIYQLAKMENCTK